MNGADPAPRNPMSRGADCAVIGLFVLALFCGFYIAREIILPIFLALFLSFIFRPVVRKLKRNGVPGVVSSGFIMVFMLGVLALAVVVLHEPAAEWMDRAPQTLKRIEDKLQPIKETLDQARQASENIERVARGSSDPPARVVVQDAPLLTRVVGYTWTTVVQTVVTVVLFFFLLSEGGRGTSGALMRVLSPRHVEAIERAVEDVENRVSTYLGTLVLINVGVGFFTTVAMFALGVPNPLLWGVVAALLGPIPYVGPCLTILMLVVVGVSAYTNWLMVFAPALAYTAINQVESEIVTPLVLGRALKLSPVAVFLSIMFWTWLWGVIGAFLAVPILVVGGVVLEHITRPEPAGTLAQRIARAP